MALVLGSQAADLQHDVCRRGRSLVYDQRDLAADHHFGQFLFRGLGGCRLACDPAVAQDNDPIGNGHHLF